MRDMGKGCGKLVMRACHYHCVYPPPPPPPPPPPQSTGKMDPCRFVEVTSTMAARVFNIYPQKVCISAHVMLVWWLSWLLS